MDNPELGRKVLDHIEAHPEEFDMRHWGRDMECGTAACLAGHAMLQSGYRFDGDDGLFFRPDGTSVGGWEGDEAARLLGLTEIERFGAVDDEDGLFSCCLVNSEAIVIFRAIVEASEAARAAVS